MTGVDILNIIGGIISVGSFIFAVWVWLRSDMKIKELRETIATIDNIAGTAIWEYHISPARDYELRLRQAEKIIGFVSSIRKITERYCEVNSTTFDSSINLLIKKNILWTVARLYDFEISQKVTEVWVVSKDLKPDSSDEEVGKLINRNLRKNAKYVYFCSANLPHIEAEISRLYKNLRVNDNKIKSRFKVVKVPIDHENIFSSGNMVFYFNDESRSIPPKCFQEIYFSQLSERGAFWQEHIEDRATQLRYIFEAELLRDQQVNQEPGNNL